MQLKLRITQNKLSWLLAVCALLAMGSYLTWSTFSASIGKVIYVAIQFVTVFCIIWYSYNKQKKYCIERKNLIIIAIIIINTLRLILDSESIIHYGPNLMISALILCLFVSCDKQLICSTYEKFVILFIICSLPSVIIWAVRSLGISIPHAVLYPAHQGKAALGVFYENYGIGLVLSGKSATIRPCGIFDEPGVIGTFSGLLLAPYILRTKIDKKGILLIVIGALSTSFAFYIIAAIALVLSGVINRTKSLLFIGVVIIGGMAVVSFFSDLPLFSTIINRFIRASDSGGIFSYMVDSRTSDGVNQEWSNFINGNIWDLLFGKGDAYLRDSAINVDVSYKSYIIKYGFCGIGLCIGLLLAMLRREKFTIYGLAILIIFLASMYQRIYIINWPYLLVFMGSVITVTQRKGYNDE